MSSIKYGQSLMDRVISAKHSITGQELMKAVHKATTEEMLGSKRKHLDYLIICTNDDAISMYELANTLIQRTLNKKWVVVFKSLISIHDLMNYGNERFIQYMASSNTFLNSINFQDNSDGLAYHMSKFIRRYARYINTIMKAYRHLGFDIRRQEKDFEFSIEEVGWIKFISNVAIIKELNDSLLRFEVSKKDLTNGVINVAFLSLYKDLIKFFNGYTMHISKIIDYFFTFDKIECKKAYSLYNEYVFLSSDVQSFLKVADEIGIDKYNIPNLNRVPLDLKPKFEAYLKSIDVTFLEQTFTIGIPRLLSYDETGVISEANFRSKSEKKYKANTESNYLRRAVSLKEPKKNSNMNNNLLITESTIDELNETDALFTNFDLRANLDNVTTDDSQTEYNFQSLNLESSKNINHEIIKENVSAPTQDILQNNNIILWQEPILLYPYLSLEEKSEGIPKPPPGFSYYGDILQPQKLNNSNL